jgi:diacylglycerol kinase (ATP)
MTQSSNFAPNAFISVAPAIRSRKVSKSYRSIPENPLKRQNAWHVAPDIFTSFRYAWSGVKYAFLTQRNFRIHTLVGCLAISLAIYAQVEPVAIALIVLTSALVMVLELLNTALESVVDLTVGQSYHELAKIAKDCAAGAVLIAAIAAVLVGSCILSPALWMMVSG